MTFKSPQSLKTIAELINAKFIGDENFQVFGTNEIHRVKAGEIVFVNHPKYYNKALNSDATIILIDKEVDCPEGKALLVSDDPFRDFNKINEHYLLFIKKGDITRFIPDIKFFIDECSIENEFYSFRHFILNHIELFFEDIGKQRILKGLISKKTPK